MQPQSPNVHIPGVNAREAQARLVDDLGAREAITPRTRAKSKILLIDDSETMRSYLRATLTDSFPEADIIEAADGLSGFKAMAEQAPDVVLCDLQMPFFDGLKLLALRATRKELLEIPLLMLTAEHEAERKVEVLTQGAADYVTKPFHGMELAARVRIHLGLKHLKDELRAANAQLAELATTDELTSLSNRRHFDQLLLDEVQRTARYGTPLSLVILDVDHFKSVNDTHGHAMGDEVLRNLGAILRGAVRSTDRVGRIGGEEFALLLPHTDQESGLGLCERLRARVEAAKHTWNGVSIQCTISIGVASSGRLSLTAMELMQRADKALYEAKGSGRNKVVGWSETRGAETSASPRDVAKLR